MVRMYVLHVYLEEWLHWGHTCDWPMEYRYRPTKNWGSDFPYCILRILIHAFIAVSTCTYFTMPFFIFPCRAQFAMMLWWPVAVDYLKHVEWPEKSVSGMERPRPLYCFSFKILLYFWKHSYSTKSTLIHSLINNHTLSPNRLSVAGELKPW